MSKALLAYLPLGLLCIASFQYRVYDGVQFHGDESTWLANSRALWLALSGDFENAYWQSYDGWTQPHAGHYVYALVLRACGHKPESLHQRYASGKPLTWNLRHGRVPSKDVLLAGRRFSALCGALACLVLCEIGRRMFGWTTGIVAACWLAGSPLMRHVSQRAMIDGMLTLGLTAGVLLMIMLFKCWQSRSTPVVLLLSAAAGLFFGCVASLKINGGILCVVAIGAWPCYAAGVYPQNRKGALSMRAARNALARAAGSVLLACAAAVATFYALNPQMWTTGLIEGTRITTQLRFRDVSSQQQSHPEHALKTVRQRIDAATDMYFVRWPTLRTGALEDFRFPLKAGDRPTGLWQIEGPLFLIGVVYLFARIIRRTRRNALTDPACIVVLWLVFYSAFVCLGVPLLWPRYFQTILPLQALAFAIATTALVKCIRWLRRGRTTLKASHPETRAH